jgi:high affinity Mn2+ porin
MILRTCLLFCVAACVHCTSRAQEPEEEQWGVYGQFTNVSQRHQHFHAPYSGANSMRPDEGIRETTDATLYAGRRLGPGTEAWVNLEVDQGFGLSDTLGAAGFPSGEAYKIGAHRPYLRIPRVFLRHVVPLGRDRQTVEPGPNQLGGRAAAENLTLTVGKFSVVDIFDTNTYAHDPRTDFLNWSIIDGGAFDYAADPWGYTLGAAAEWNRGWWTWRAGVFQLSEVPNAKMAGLHPHQHMLVTEFEGRFTWRRRPGKAKLLVFVNRADMGSYADAVLAARASGGVPDVARVRRYRSRFGAAFNLEQELGPELGMFVRASASDGSKEAYEFTEINRSLAVGLSLKGGSWGRRDDRLGVAAVVNGIAADARSYFAAGGLGILIGDGALRYGAERIFETYYSFQWNASTAVSFDFQHLRNPAYNRDRGPINIGAFRLHLQF